MRSSLLHGVYLALQPAGAPQMERRHPAADDRHDETRNADTV
jgi:hypothetical protein